MAFNSFAGMETHLHLMDNGISQSKINWEDILCPVCLEFPHNAVLLQCSSHKSGCRPFVCDTDHSHSNCLERFRIAYGMEVPANPSSTVLATPNDHVQSTLSDPSDHPACPLCRGTVSGWVVVHEARENLNLKTRSCEVKNCTFIGNYTDLHKHVKLNHPDARPSEIDPVKKLEWDSLQQSSEIIDALTTIHSEVPHGVVSGDYVIEYIDNDSGDEFEDFPGDEGNWWTSCILYHVFDNFRNSRNRRRSRQSDHRLEHQVQSSNTSDTTEVPQSSAVAEQRFDETDDEQMGSDGSAGGFSYRSSRRRRIGSSFSRHLH